MPQVKAKFSITNIETNGAYTQVSMQPVSSDDPNHENKQYWAATPAGSIYLGVNNQEAFAGYSNGDEVYVTFEKATGTEG
jgi:hypothetical protein